MAVKARGEFAGIGIQSVDIADVAVVDLLVVVVLDPHDLVTGGEGPAELSIFRSPAGLSAACNSMLSDRTPMPPRFIGQRTWISRMGLRPNRRGIRVFTSSIMRCTAASGCSTDTK